MDPIIDKIPQDFWSSFYTYITDSSFKYDANKGLIEIPDQIINSYPFEIIMMRYSFQCPTQYHPHNISISFQWKYIGRELDDLEKKVNDFGPRHLIHVMDKYAYEATVDAHRKASMKIYRVGLAPVIESVHYLEHQMKMIIDRVMIHTAKEDSMIFLLPRSVSENEQDYIFVFRTHIIHVVIRLDARDKEYSILRAWKQPREEAQRIMTQTTLNMLGLIHFLSVYGGETWMCIHGLDETLRARNLKTLHPSQKGDYKGSLDRLNKIPGNIILNPDIGKIILENLKEFKTNDVAREALAMFRRSTSSSTQTHVCARCNKHVPIN